MKTLTRILFRTVKWIAASAAMSYVVLFMIHAVDGHYSKASTALALAAVATAVAALFSGVLCDNDPNADKT